MKFVRGAAFTAEMSRERLVVSLLAEGIRRTVLPSKIESLEMLSNGSTKIMVKLGRDVVVPTTREEYGQLKRFVNQVLSEMRSNRMRRKQAARESRRVYERGRAKGIRARDYMEPKARGHFRFTNRLLPKSLPALPFKP